MRVRCAHMCGHTHKGDLLTRLCNSRFPLPPPPPLHALTCGDLGVYGAAVLVVQLHPQPPSRQPPVARVALVLRRRGQGRGDA